MTKKEKTDIFNDYRYLIQKISHSFYVTNPGIDYNELLSEGYIGFLNSIDSYNPDKYAISTFIRNCVKNHLINYCRNYYHKNQCIYLDNIDIYAQKKTEGYINLFEKSNNNILQGIVKAIKSAMIEKNKHHRKYGWLDKKVHEITGESYSNIWNGFKTAETLIKGV